MKPEAGSDRETGNAECPCDKEVLVRLLAGSLKKVAREKGRDVTDRGGTAVGQTSQKGDLAVESLARSSRENSREITGWREEKPVILNFMLTTTPSFVKTGKL